MQADDHGKQDMDRLWRRFYELEAEVRLLPAHYIVKDMRQHLSEMESDLHFYERVRRK